MQGFQGFQVLVLDFTSGEGEKEGVAKEGVRAKNCIPKKEEGEEEWLNGACAAAKPCEL